MVNELAADQELEEPSPLLNGIVNPRRRPIVHQEAQKERGGGLLRLGSGAHSLKWLFSIEQPTL